VVAGEVDELEDQAVHGRLELQRDLVEAEGDAVLVVDDAVDGQAAGPRRELAIEQDHQPGDAVPGLDGVVVQEPPSGRPALVGVERAVEGQGPLSIRYGAGAAPAHNRRVNSWRSAKFS
jgi:hypothetical protein